MRLSFVSGGYISLVNASIPASEPVITNVFVCAEPGCDRPRNETAVASFKKSRRWKHVVGAVGTAAIGAVLGGAAAAGVSALRGRTEQDKKESSAPATRTPVLCYPTYTYYC